jgi:hypothetical protein
MKKYHFGHFLYVYNHIEAIDVYGKFKVKHFITISTASGPPAGPANVRAQRGGGGALS